MSIERAILDDWAEASYSNERNVDRHLFKAHRSQVIRESTFQSIKKLRAEQ